MQSTKIKDQVMKHEAESNITNQTSNHKTTQTC